MTLVNTKFKKFITEPTDILRILLALVFLSAGLFRIFNYVGAGDEFVALHLPAATVWLVIIFELGAGACLLMNRFLNLVYGSLLIFITIALGLALTLYGATIVSQLGELFVFDLNPTDLFLHFVFLLIIISLLLKKNQQ